MRNIANGTSPYPLHKGDFFLLVILNGVKNLECIAQPSPFTRGIWTDVFRSFAIAQDDNWQGGEKKPQFPHFASSKRWMNSRPRSVHTR